MDQTTLLIASTAIASGLFLLGVPIFLCISTWTLLASLIIDFSVQNISVTSYQGISSYALLAMPLIILTGNLIGSGGTAAKLSRLAETILRTTRGGMLLATILSSSMFSGICGSSSATEAPVARDMTQGKAKHGCDYQLRGITAGGIVGILILPSIMLVVYAFMTNLSVIDLLTAGWLPGICVCLGLGCGVSYWCRKHNWGESAPFDLDDFFKALWDAKFAFGALFLIIVLLYGGFSSLAETASVVAFYFFSIGIFVTKRIRVQDIPAIFLSSGRINGILAPTIAIAIVMQQMLSIIGLHKIVHDFVNAFMQPWAVLIAIMAALIFFSCIMQAVSVCVILAPIMAPVAVSLGMNPYHFGLVFIVGLSFGFIIPSLGLDFFITPGTSATPPWRLIPWLPHYLVGACIAWIFIAYVPEISLVLLKLVGGGGF